MNKWPDEVPVLSASDICRDHMTCGQQHCLMGWKNYVLPGGLISGVEFYNEIQRVSEELGCNGYGPSGITDTRSNRKRTVARIWNRFIARLGYIYDAKTGKVINPECDRIGRLKPVKKGAR